MKPEDVRIHYYEITKVKNKDAALYTVYVHGCKCQYETYLGFYTKRTKDITIEEYIEKCKEEYIKQKTLSD